MNSIPRTLLVGATLATPSLAFAHSPVEGMNHFYSGVLHPIFVPAQLMLLIALGLYFGQRDVSHNQIPITAFLGATVVSLIVSAFAPVVELQIVLLIATIVIGLLIAANLAMNLALRIILGVAAGLLLGLDSAQETLSGIPKLVTLFGCLIGITLMLTFPMALVDRFNRLEWQRIGVRVVGSWLAACAVMVVAFFVGR